MPNLLFSIFITIDIYKFLFKFKIEYFYIIHHKSITTN